MLDREFQKSILTELAEIYPHSADLRRSFQEHEARRLTVNLHYLAENGLIALNAQTMMDQSIDLRSCKITASGLDFISNDGGLSAILGVVTVKLHEDTVKALLIEKVQSSDADDGVKASLVQKLKALPAEAMQQLTMQALEKGVQSLPSIVPWLLKLLSP